MSFRIFLLLLCLGLICNSQLQAQKSIRKLIKEADDYMEHEKYDEALRLLRQYHRESPNDLEAKYKIGIAAYHQNQLPDAERFLRYALDNDRKPEDNTYLYLGLTAHQNHQFNREVTVG